MELGLYLNTNALCVFFREPPSIDDAVNASLQEKVRRFNTAANILADSVNAIDQIFVENVRLIDKCQDKDTEVDRVFRRLVRTVYIEIAIYQEKLLNMAYNLCFVEETRSRRYNISVLKRRAKHYPGMKLFIKKCKDLIKDEKFRFVADLRNDEVHNMSQIDSFQYDLKNAAHGIDIINLGYRISAKTLRDNYMYALEKLSELRNILQEILSTENMWKTYYALEKDNQKIWINTGHRDNVGGKN